ncbi:UNVERIFIED_CONTAM: Regulator of nonsense transcripts UPF2 [Sesamum radiatum]|uniref:Regulator of nonsense transcripts UPF2 n=1 Tax=Sesamum radiatum TaxID=300843 RepID=A0AAW2VLF4_SESRA
MEHGDEIGGEHQEKHDDEGRHDDEEAAARLEEFKKSVEAKMALRQSNLNPDRPDSGFLRTLDSSIKRNTAVIKKLKQINEEQKEGLMDELRSVNLSKFVSEAVTAICDAKLKSADIQPAVQICSLLHQRYKDFSPSLVQGLLKVFAPGKSAEDLDADKNSRAMKKRSTLKLLLELYFVGVVEDSGIFVNIIKDLTSTEHLKDRDATQTNLSLLASFARQGRFLLGLPLTDQDILEEFMKGLNITLDQKKFFRKAFQTYYDAAVELLQAEHASLRQMEHENAKILNAKGELSEENASTYEKLRKSHDNLSRAVSSLAEALDMQPPVMPEDGHTTRVTSGEDVLSPVAGKDSSALEALWDDEDTRAFYECLPDLRAFVPAVLLGEAEPKLTEQSSKTQELPSDTAPESDKGQIATQESPEVSADSGILLEDKDGKDKDKEEKDKEKGKEKDAERRVEGEKDRTKGLDGTNLEGLLHRLPSCVSRDLIDQLTESLDSRKLELRSRPTINMMIPMNVFEGPAKEHHGRGTEGESGDETTDEGSGGTKEIRVKVLVKRGNKQQTKQMYIPRDCSLVQSTKQKEAAELEEKQDIKRLVLEYNDREEEELNGGTQPLNWTQSGGRVTNRGHTWDGHNRSGGSRHRHIYHSGAGVYYGRRR